MATLVHVTPMVYASLGLVMLRVDTSGDLPPGGLVSIGRREVGGSVISDITVPAGYLDASGDVKLIEGSGLFADTTVSLDTAVEYLAGLPGQTLTVATGSVTVASGTVWRLGDPARPYLDLPLALSSADARGCPSPAPSTLILSLSPDSLNGQGEMAQIPGRRDPAVSEEPIATPTFEIQLATRTEADRVAVEALLATGDRLLLRAPAVYQMAPRYVMVTQVEIARISADHRRQWRKITIQVREVGQPVVTSYGWLGARWMDQCSGGYATWAAMKVAGLSWASLGEGIGGGVYPTAMRTWTEVAATWATWGALTATGKTWAQVLEGS